MSMKMILIPTEQRKIMSARATSGHAAAAPPRRVMNWRRFTPRRRARAGLRGGNTREAGTHALALASNFDDATYRNPKVWTWREWLAVLALAVATVVVIGMLF
jgi:hypothetical protein